MAAGPTSASRLAAGPRRPAPAEFDAALRAHRDQPAEPEPRRVLLLLLFRSVALQASELAAWQFRPLAHREDELVLRTMARIEGRTAEKTALPDALHTPLAPHALDASPVPPVSHVPPVPEASDAAATALLADYEFRPQGRSIYAYVAQKTLDIARNMQAEAYVPDAGFWSKDLVARFKSLETPYARAARRGLQIELPIASSDDEGDADAPTGPVPTPLQFSETPLRHSVLRINSLAGSLDALGGDMVGRTITIPHAAASSEVRLTVNHQRIWRAWLGLSHPELIDLGEDDMATALGISKATATRDTSAAFAFMLGHADLRALLVLMAPNRFQGGSVSGPQHDAQLDELEKTLRGPNGKRFFRKCVHQWLGEHL